MAAVVKDVAPYEKGPLFRELYSSDVLHRQLSSDEDFGSETVDNTLMEALSECYQAASSWETRRQILSIIANKVRCSKLLQFIPGLTKYRFTQTKRHCLTYERGASVPLARVARTDVTTLQIEHFIRFISSSHVVQNLPLGERSITLSKKEIIKIPNVVRIMIPERVVKQYLAFCNEVKFQAFTPQYTSVYSVCLSCLYAKINAGTGLRELSQQVRRHLRIWPPSSQNLKTRGKL